MVDAIVPGLPTQIAVLLGVLFGGVLISDLIGNMIAFNNRFVNALVTAIVATLLVTGLSFALAAASDDVVDDASVFVLVGAGVFVSDLIGNILVFNNRFLNAVVTALVSVVLVYLLILGISPDLLRT